MADEYQRVLDHMTIRVRDMAASRAFYAAALAPLGFGIVADYGGDQGIAFGPPGQDDFAIAPADQRPGALAAPARRRAAERPSAPGLLRPRPLGGRRLPRVRDDRRRPRQRSAGP